MLVIRQEQVETFRAAALRAFENEMVLHLDTFSPPLFKAAGAEHIRQAVHLGVSRAQSYGFANRGPIRLYLEMMLLFGSDFDTDPQYPWLAEILRDQALGSQMWRAELLYGRTLDYREKVAGPGDEYALKALRNIRSMAQKPLALTAANFVPAIMEEIGQIYPQKAAYVGAAGLTTLIHEGSATARDYHFSTPHEIALVIVLMVAFGHGCISDPLYPWIARTLQDEAIVSASARAKRLEAKALTWLDHVLAYFSEDAHA